MSINLENKTYNTVLREANEFFNAQGLSPIGDGFRELATNPTLFESYVDQLVEGCSPNSAAQMAQLMVNTNANILKESTMTGIMPIASLSMPVIRRLWPAFVLKDAIATEVAKTPAFAITYTKPYMFKGDRKVDLAYGLRSNDTVFNGTVHKDTYGDINESIFNADSALRKSYTSEHQVLLANGGAAVVDFTKLQKADSPSDPAVVIADTGSRIKRQNLDELEIEIYFNEDTTGNADSVITSKTVTSTAKVNLSEYKENKFKSMPVRGNLNIYGNKVINLDGNKGQIIVNFDGENSRASFSYVGGDTTGSKTPAVLIVTKAAVCSEYNEDAWSIGFDIGRQDIKIASGEHLSAPITVEALNDMMAIYNIDGTQQSVEIMTNVFSVQLDKLILNFLRKDILNRPSNEAFGSFGTGDKFVLSFDCRPAAGFAGTPGAWRDELRRLIDFLAQRIKNETYLQAGTFSIIANPLDAQLISNIDWTFKGGNGTEVDGVAVDYSVGTFTSTNTYRIISSVNVPVGAIYVVFIPSSSNQMTYKYFPYTFSTEMGYRDPNRNNVPSIMMTRRQALYCFMPAIGAILIANNDGTGLFRQNVPVNVNMDGYVTTKPYVEPKLGADKAN